MRNYSTVEYKEYASGYSFQKKIMASVFLWMGIGLSLTALMSYLVAATPSIMALLVSKEGISGLGYVVTFAPVVFVLLMSFGFQRISYPALLLLFVVYASIMGASLSFIFLVYTTESIYNVFFIAAAMFGSMGIIGYITKADLSRLGNILLMALLGIIVASLVNLFLHNDVLNFIITIVSVLLFCGLTAVDMQKIKMLAESTDTGREEKNKLGILGALTLYLDFINLFLSLLRLFGKRKEY